MGARKVVPAPLEKLFDMPTGAACPSCGYGMTTSRSRAICSWAACPSKGEVAATKPTKRTRLKKLHDSAEKEPVKKAGPVTKVRTKKLDKKSVPVPVPAPTPEPQKDLDTDGDDTLGAEPERDATGAPIVDAGGLSAVARHTREDWLTAMTVGYFRELFKRNGAPLPEKVRVSCGWPGGRSPRKAIGQCWSPAASTDQTTEIFISPVVSDALEVSAILAHELVHAAIGTDKGHGPIFRKLALKIGLEGRMTATTAGDALKQEMADYLATVAPYPHARMSLDERKKQTTRLLKVFCPNALCQYVLDQARKPKPYTVRMAATVFDAGAPHCGCCGQKMLCDMPEGDE